MLSGCMANATSGQANMETNGYKLTSSGLALRMAEAAGKELERGPAPGSGFTTLGYQGLWNDSKFGPQAIFDPLAVFLTLVFVDISAYYDKKGKTKKRNLEEMMTGIVRLLRVTLDEELEIEDPCGRRLNHEMFVPKMFVDEEDWWNAKRILDANHKVPDELKPKLVSPFEKVGESLYTRTVDRWYGLDDQY